MRIGSQKTAVTIPPTKLSLTMDGIGGIIIGNIFQIPEENLPEGYKGKNKVGRKIGYIVTGIGHKISITDWTTTIDAQTIILSEQDKRKDYSYDGIIIPNSEITLPIVNPTILPNQTSSAVVSKPQESDDNFYKEILMGLSAPISEENLKFLYAWRQAEGGNAYYNPFNSTKKTKNSTAYNRNNGYPVQNYTSRQEGIKATVDTLKLGYYNKIRNGLQKDIGSLTISSYIDELTIWGTKDGIKKTLLSKIINPPKIAPK